MRHLGLRPAPLTGVGPNGRHGRSAIMTLAAQDSRLEAAPVTARILKMGVCLALGILENVASAKLNQKHHRVYVSLLDRPFMTLKICEN